MAAVSEDAALERNRRSSREAKRRRTGVCVDCGQLTRYNGSTVNGPSVRCHPCAAAKSGADKKRWTQGAIIAAMRLWEHEHGKPPMQHNWNRQNDERFPHFMSVVRAFGSWSAGKQAAGYGDGRARGH